MFDVSRYQPPRPLKNQQNVAISATRRKGLRCPQFGGGLPVSIYWQSHYGYFHDTQPQCFNMRLTNVCQKYPDE